MDNEYHQIMPKISGYLEKKGRKKMMSCYKKYWFVLEGRLLLYYKSKDEYDAISPCKGSINLGPTSVIKPCTSNTGVFQIESKTTTITLRAETWEDQNKWMHALISALNQRSKNYFRHSSGELSPRAKKFVLERQYTLPQDLGSSNQAIIQKMQKIGGKSYGIELQSKRMLERQKQISFSDESLPSSSNFSKEEFRLRKTESVIAEQQEFGNLESMRRVNSIESVADSSDGIYEKIPSSDSVFIRGKEDLQSIDNKVLHYVEVEQSRSTEDNIYSEPKEILESENGNNRSSFITENDVYWNKCSIQKVTSNYCYDTIDYNDNNIQAQLRLKKSNKEESLYAEAETLGNRSSGNSVEYADIEQVVYADIGQYTKTDGARNSSLSSQGSNEEKRMFAFGKKNKHSKEKPDEKKRKVRKSESFLQRVWHKKSKNKKNKKEISMSTDNIAEKAEMSDVEAIQTLSELEDLLKKQTAIVKQLHDSKQVKQSVIGDAEKEESEVVINDMYMDSGNIGQYQSQDSQQTCPSLPPRNQNQASTSLYEKPPKIQPPSVPPKMKRRMETELLDDILSDLKSQSETLEKGSSGKEEVEIFGKKDDNKEGKVKELIKQFSIGKEEGVELREKNNNWKLKARTSTAGSNDLHILLDELAKVTTAPIMTPGVTTSLINPEISDKEILKLVPIRRRRLSDPDYDVPRPHRSLTNLPKKDDNALEATRFFGPILKPSDYESHAANRPPTPPADYHSNLPSIAPDSLEVDGRRLELSHDELRKFSFESHDYLSYNKASHHNLAFLVENNLYADPRLLFKSKNEFSMYPEGASLLHSGESDNRFIDSLEP